MKAHQGYTIELLGLPFDIDLMPVELDSFDVIIGMDWLANNHAMIVCDMKIVCIPCGNEILIIQGDRSDKKKKLTLSGGRGGFEAEVSARGTIKIVVDPLVTGGISESTRGDALDPEGTLYDIIHYMLKVPLDRITKFKTAQR
nr:reverse transcriptase domain-containing protein [Tanacetum cinerariifolium]